MTVANNRLLPFVSLFGAQLAIGSAAIFARVALHGASASTISALRLTLAVVPLLVVLAFQKKISLPIVQNVRLFLAGIALAAHFAFWISSLQFISVATSTLLVSTTPAWTTLYEVIVEKRKMHWSFWLALIAAALGIALITGGTTSKPPLPGREPYGCLLALLGAVAIGAYLTIVRPLLNEIGTLHLVVRTYGSAAAVLWAVVLMRCEQLPGADLTTWAAIGGMAFVSQLVGHTAVNASLRWYRASTVAFSTLLEPIAAALLAFLIFGEFFSWLGIMGAALVLGSLARILQLEGHESKDNE